MDLKYIEYKNSVKPSENCSLSRSPLIGKIKAYTKSQCIQFCEAHFSPQTQDTLSGIFRVSISK